MDFGFTVLGLQHIWRRYDATNERARAVPDGVGFQEVGRLRHATKIGPYRDAIVIMDILVSEFLSPVLAANLRPPGSAPQWNRVARILEGEPASSAGICRERVLERSPGRARRTSAR